MGNGLTACGDGDGDGDGDGLAESVAVLLALGEAVSVGVSVAVSLVPGLGVPETVPPGENEDPAEGGDDPEQAETVTEASKVKVP